MATVDLSIVLSVYGALAAFFAVFSVGLGWQFTRESRRELKETIIVQGERTNRLIREWRREHEQHMREMDAHIGMILERIDRDR